MARWILALALSSAITLVGVPRSRHWAFRTGRFERSTQTQRRRSQRRPTQGGLVLAVAVAVGALVAGPSQPMAQATSLAAGIALLAGFRLERGRGPAWLERWGALLAVLALPVCGIRAGLTGRPGLDLALTALLGVVMVQGLRSLTRTDATVPLVSAIASGALLLIAVRVDDPVAAVAAAVLGGSIGMVAHTWPPAAVRIGGIGPSVLGVALTAVAVGQAPEVLGPRSVLVPVLALLLIGVAALVPEWDRRLARRHLPPRIGLGLAAGAGAVAAERLSAGRAGPAPRRRARRRPRARALAGRPRPRRARVGAGAEAVARRRGGRGWPRAPGRRRARRAGPARRAPVDGDRARGGHGRARCGAGR